MEVNGQIRTYGEEAAYEIRHTGAGREAGRQVKPEVPGADYVDRSMVSADEFTAEMQTYLQDDYWVAVWCVRVWTVG